MVDKGIAYLERAEYTLVSGEYIGGYILVGYTVYKVTATKSIGWSNADWKMPLNARPIRKTRAEGISKIVYDASIAAIFLADVDPALYRPQLVQIRDFLRYAQKKHGGFGYLNSLPVILRKRSMRCWLCGPWRKTMWPFPRI